MSIESTIFWQGEVQLLQWSETNTRGRTVSLQLGEDDDTHPFKHQQTKAGKTAGRRFMCVFVEIGEDEKPIERTPSQLAYLYCKDEMFWRWADERSFDNIVDEDSARAFILTQCGIKSRSQLDTNATARAHWESLVAAPFNEYRNKVTQL